MRDDKDPVLLAEVSTIFLDSLRQYRTAQGKLWSTCEVELLGAATYPGACELYEKWKLTFERLDAKLLRVSRRLKA